MNMEKIILTDADGVLINWNDTFDEYITARGYEGIPLTDHYYNLASRYRKADGSSAEWQEIAQLVRDFNQSEHIATLPAYKDSQRVIADLVEHDFSFIVVTSLSDHPDAHEYRTQNLKGLFGDVFDEIVCLETGASKQHILTRWAGSGYFWIEDHFKNAEAGHEVGLKPILVDTPYNRHFQTDLFPRVDEHKPWADIYKHVIEEYGLVSLEVA
jgi:FMN phosphatase YigB (HAD superfamily)